MSGATIKVKGLEAAMQKLRDLKEQQKSRIPQVVANVLVAGVKENFQRGVNPDTGATWAPIKNRKGQALVDKGVLRRSIHAEVNGTSVAIGTNLIYAATHQFGDPYRIPKHARVLVFKVMGMTVFAKKVSIPARPFLPQSDAGLQRTAPGLTATLEKIFAEQWS